LKAASALSMASPLVDWYTGRTGASLFVIVIVQAVGPFANILDPFVKDHRDHSS
jgi:hypothetical protein